MIGGGGGGGWLGIESKNGTRDNENNHRDGGIDRNLGPDNGTEEPYWRLSRYSRFEHDTASRTLVTLKSFLCCYHSPYLTGWQAQIWGLPVHTEGKKYWVKQVTPALGFVHTIPYSSYAGTKTISHGPSVHTAEERGFRSGFCIKHYEAAPHRSWNWIVTISDTATLRDSVNKCLYHDGGFFVTIWKAIQYSVDVRLTSLKRHSNIWSNK